MTDWTSEDLHLELLADHPDAIEVVGRWYWDEWGSVAGESLADSIARTAGFQSRLGPPLIVLARDDEGWLGAAQLKVREMSIYPQFEHWIGGVYVDPRGRGRGIGSRLVADVMARARAAGISRLYLQTEELNGGLYRRHGFEPIEQVVYHGNGVLVMTAAVAGTP